MGGRRRLFRKIIRFVTRLGWTLRVVTRPLVRLTFSVKNIGWHRVCRRNVLVKPHIITLWHGRLGWQDVLLVFRRGRCVVVGKMFIHSFRLWRSSLLSLRRLMRVMLLLGRRRRRYRRRSTPRTTPWKNRCRLTRWSHLTPCLIILVSRLVNMVIVVPRSILLRFVLSW